MKTSTFIGLAGCLLGASLFVACDILNDVKDSNKEPSPSGFSYSTPGAFYAPNVAIASDTPHFTTGGVHHYSISPALPSGLSLDTSTGIISGTPVAELATTTYTVTAKSDTILTASVTLTVSHWVGVSKDSLQDVSQMLVRGGEIFVANRSSTNPGVAVIDTGTGKITAYYSEQLPPSSMAFTQDNHLIITETNYVQGAVSSVDLTNKSIQKSVISFGSDNFTDTATGKVFLFDRTTGVLTGFTGHAPNLNVTFNVQAGSNPYDIAISNGKAFVSRYDSKYMLILDPTQLGGGTRDSIDLSQYVSHHPVDTAAPAPRMAWVTSFNGYVFVALQRLNYKYSAVDTGLVVVINATTKQITSTIPLHFKNALSAHVVGSTWYITGIANYDQSGGVEKIDLAQRIHTGNVVTAQSLSADIFDFVPAGDHSGYVAYSTDYGYTTKVKKVAY